MATDITLPKLSDTMDEGKVLRWLKRVGDHVSAGEVIAEVETDKADMEVEAASDGVISEIRVPAGETAAVGAVLAVLDGAAKGIASKPEAEAAKPNAGAQADADRSVAEEKPERAAQPARKPDEARAERPGAAAQPARAAAPVPSPAASEPLRKPRASPLAQRLARERGVDLGQVRGSGAEGKIVARDVEAPSPAPAEGRAVRAAPEFAPGRLELSKMRQSIARRMTEAKQTIPHFYVTADIEMDEALRLIDAFKQQVDPKVTVSHLVAKAAALALLAHPRVNGQWLDGAVEIPAAINIGLAVAVEDGLIVPVIHGCEALSLRELAVEARRLVAAAREGRFAGDDLKGGTFSISNLGILDVDEFAAIINPPQAAILAVGSIKTRPVVRHGALAVGKTMRVTLSCDHRQLNGVEGAQYLETLRSILENPLRMIV